MNHIEEPDHCRHGVYLGGRCLACETEATHASNDKTYDCKHKYFDGACLLCGKETPERTPETYEFTIEELETLWKHLEKEFLNYHIEGLKEVVDKIQKIVVDHAKLAQ